MGVVAPGEKKIEIHVLYSNGVAVGTFMKPNRLRNIGKF